MGKTQKVLFIIDLTASVCIIGLLIASLTIDKVQSFIFLGFEAWKWCVLVLIILRGRTVAGLFVEVLAFLIERSFLLKTKLLYFVQGLKCSFLVFIWVGLVLVSWILLFCRGINQSKESIKIVNYVTRALASCLIGVALWMVKTLLIELVASSMLVEKFFDRIQESIFHQQVLRDLWGSCTAMTGLLILEDVKRSKGETEVTVIDVEKLKKMKKERVYVSTMKQLTDAISHTGLRSLSDLLNQRDNNDEQTDADVEINVEREAKNFADKFFMEVAEDPNAKSIENEKLLLILNQEDFKRVIPLFKGAKETGRIKRSVFRKWVVKVYQDRESLLRSLKGREEAIEDLNKLASGIFVIVIIVAWLLLMGFLTIQLFILILSQIILVNFIFGNTARTVFEAIIFLFVIHPFDVGDRCEIDGVQMIVDDMNILNTVFLKYDGEKMYYPNTVLTDKTIINFYGSPDMTDSVEFTIDVHTSIKTIGHLKARIKEYLESKPKHWLLKHQVVIKTIDDINKIVIIHVNHAINYRNGGDRSKRRAELVDELKKIIKELGIGCPQAPQ